MTVKIRYNMPVHNRPDLMPPDVRSEWARMTIALRRHEEKHGQHAINADHKIERAGCVGGLVILRKWRGQDRALDAHTQHGQSEGVFLQ